MPVDSALPIGPPPVRFRATYLPFLCLAAAALSGCCSQPARENGSTAFVPVDTIPSVPEMARARASSRLTYLTAPDGVRIPVRVFGEQGAGIPVVMTHGLQSHSGWFVQSGQFLASLGCPVYALDRRGSGMSRELRGHCSDFREMVADISFVCEYVMNRHRVAKVHVVGHCFGAIPASVFACQHPDKVETLVLTTPGIYTHSDLSLWQKLSIFLWRIEGRVCYIPVPLDVDEFSDLEPYRRFIREDPLAVTAATSEFYFEVHQARLFLKANINKLTMPILMALAAEDRISDNDDNASFFMALPSRQKRLLMYADAIHILEFSREREAFFADLADWIRYAGASSGRAFSP